MNRDKLFDRIYAHQYYKSTPGEITSPIHTCSQFDSQLSSQPLPTNGFTPTPINNMPPWNLIHVAQSSSFRVGD